MFGGFEEDRYWLMNLLVRMWPLVKRSIDNAGYSGAAGNHPLQAEVAELESFLKKHPEAQGFVKWAEDFVAKGGDLSKVS